MTGARIAAAIALGATGDHRGAVASLLETLETTLPPADRAHVLAHLADEYRLLDRLDEATRTAREATALATSAADRHAEARGAFALGTVLLEHFERDGAEAHLEEAMELLDRAAEAYHELGKIDFSSVLLTMAEAFRMIGEHEAARGLYTRVTRELADERWAAPIGIARHADHVRGRALLGLGSIALAIDQRDEAARMFAAAAEQLVASHDPASAPLLDDLADTLEQVLGDAAMAARIRIAARS